MTIGEGTECPAESSKGVEFGSAELSSPGGVSHRSQQVTNSPSFLFKWLAHAASNPYSKADNPQGVVNLGTAENKLCEDLLVEKLSQPDVNETKAYMNYYFTHCGDISFRSGLKRFLEEKFNPSQRLYPDNIVTAAGCGAILDMIGFALGEKDDYFLSPSPYYPRIKNNLGERAGVQVYDVPLTSQLQPGDMAPFQLTARKLEAAFHRATKEGKRIKGIILINPNNPLGDVYSEKQLRDILEFAARYQLHVVSDEIYALSTCDENSEFRSILSIKDMPDPERVHFVWGFSKDFGLAGYRCGLLYTTNQDVLKFCQVMAYYQAVPMCVQNRLKNMISDRDWRDRVYFPTNRARIRAHLEMCQSRLGTVDVPIHPYKGGLFIWVNMKKYLGKIPTFDEETRLFEELIKNGVYCVPGRSMRCVEPGWFRIIFTVTTDELTAGLDRIQETLSLRSKDTSRFSVEEGNPSTVQTRSFKEQAANGYIKHHGVGSCPPINNGVSEAKPQSVNVSTMTSYEDGLRPTKSALRPSRDLVESRNTVQEENEANLNTIQTNKKTEKKRFFNKLGEYFRTKFSTRHAKRHGLAEASNSNYNRRAKSETDLLAFSYRVNAH